MRVFCLLIRRCNPGSLPSLMVLVLATALLGCVPQVASADGPFALSNVAEPYPVCPEATTGHAECMAIRVPTVSASSADAVGPDLEGGGEYGGFDPKDLREAYKLSETGGSTQTVALIDAYNDPYAESDLQKYREKYKVYYKGTETACTEANGCFKKVNQTGETKNYPANEEGWSGEISLDVDMVSAACPQCHILLVEANNEELSSLFAANEEAVKLKATEVSNSWGAQEFSEETSDDKYFDHPGIPMLAAAGDVKYDGCDHKLGTGICYPAASQYVIAVGGTKLTKESSSSRKWTEEVWKEESRSRGTGSGCSKYDPKPKWQKELPTKDSYCEHRLDNDVAADASVESPVSVYDSYISGGWEDFGGTSASSPFVAGVEALSNEYARSLGAEAFYVAGKKSLLFDVTKGNNGTCTPPAEDAYWCTAEEGYDGPTGNGTPDGPLELASAPPANTVLPVTSPATPDQAVPESTTTGAWTNEPTYIYQWERCNATGGECKEISGATSSKYTPVEADVEHTLVVKVTAKNSAGEGSALSKATNKVEPIGKITEYSLPSSSDPNWITAGPDGNVWFTEWKNNAVGKITSSGTITEYSIHGHPEGITAGPDGNIWAVESSGSEKIAKVTPSGTVTEYSLLSGSEARDITAGPDGNLWFTEDDTSMIGKITTSGTITEYSSKREGYGTHPWGITAGPDGNLWFTDNEGSGAVAKITTSGTITEYLLPEKHGPEGITVGPDGNLWFTTGGNKTIGKITTSGTITEYSLPKGDAHDIVSGPDSNLWFTAGSYIGKITTSGTITEYSLPKESVATGITVGSDDNVWFTDSGSNSKVGKITP